MSLATVAAVIGIGSSAYSLYNASQNDGGGGGGGMGGGQAYVPGGLGGADQWWQNLMGALGPSVSGTASAIQPQMAQSYWDMLGIPTNELQRTADEAGGYYQNLAGQTDAFHNLLTDMYRTNVGAQGDLMGAGNQLWQTSLDPQQALQNRLQQQITDASRASTSSRGIGMSPEAAGIENDTVSRFLQDWQNQQLARQYQGLQGMTGAYSQAGEQGRLGGANLAASNAMAALAPQYLQMSTRTPFDMSQMIAQRPMDLSNMFASGMNQSIWGPMAGAMGQTIPYMNYGMGAQNNAFNQNQANLGNLTYGLQQFGKTAPNAWSALSNLFTPSGGGGGGGQYSDPWAQEGFGT
jgi:hypothetical protein